MKIMSVVTSVPAFALNIPRGRRNAPITSPLSTSSWRTRESPAFIVPVEVMNATTPFGFTWSIALAKK